MMARTLEARLQSGTAQALRAANDVESQLQRVNHTRIHPMKGVSGETAGLAAALRSVLRLLDTVHQHQQVASPAAAPHAEQPRPTGARRNREIADRAWRLFRQTRPAAPAQTEERSRPAPPADQAAAPARATSDGGAGRAAPAPPVTSWQSGAGGEPHRLADILTERGAAVVHIGTYYGYKPHDAATNTETRTGD